MKKLLFLLLFVLMLLLVACESPTTTKKNADVSRYIKNDMTTDEMIDKAAGEIMGIDGFKMSGVLENKDW